MREAAQNNRAYLDRTRGENMGYIDDGQRASLANIGSGAGLARYYLSDGYYTGRDAINEGAGQGYGFLNQGAVGARGALDNARGAYDSLSALGSKYGGATTLALNALGVNGADGTAAAREAFQFSPGYQFNLDQGLDAISRRRNAGGMVDSGNADRDAQNYGAGLASQEYNSWLSNLLGFTNPELSATSGAATGRAGIDTRLADLETTLGQNRANIANSRAGMLTDLAKTYGQNMGTSYTNEGTALAGINTGAAGQRVAANNALIQPYTNSYTQEGQAQMQGNQNLWNFGMQAATAAASAAMGIPPGMGGNLFGGGSGPSAANTGVAGGGYVGTGGQIYPGPGYYGPPPSGGNFLSNLGSSFGFG